MKVFDAILLT